MLPVKKNKMTFWYYLTYKASFNTFKSKSA